MLPWWSLCRPITILKALWRQACRTHTAFNMNLQQLSPVETCNAYAPQMTCAFWALLKFRSPCMLFRHSRRSAATFCFWESMQWHSRTVFKWPSEICSTARGKNGCLTPPFGRLEYSLVVGGNCFPNRWLGAAMLPLALGGCCHYNGLYTSFVFFSRCRRSPDFSDDSHASRVAGRRERGSYGTSSVACTPLAVGCCFFCCVTWNLCRGFLQLCEALCWKIQHGRSHAEAVR